MEMAKKKVAGEKKCSFIESGGHMERKVAVIHTTVVTCDGINSRLKALVPDAEVMNIVDDSL